MLNFWDYLPRSILLLDKFYTYITFFVVLHLCNKKGYVQSLPKMKITGVYEALKPWTFCTFFKILKVREIKLSGDP